MIKIQLASDLHTEMHSDHGVGVAAELGATAPKVDVLVLAGDICSAKNKSLPNVFLSLLAPHYKYIIYIVGNHEFYRTSPSEGWQNLRAAAKNFTNVYIPNNEIVTIEGQRFICGTGWFPHLDPIGTNAKRFMNDFYQIRDLEPWVYEQNIEFRTLLEKELQEDDIIITHHLPSRLSTPARFKNDPINAFFIADFHDLIVNRQPKLWLHGHTHDRCDYKIGSTRVVANPLGYPSEGVSQRAFDPELVISI